MFGGRSSDLWYQDVDNWHKERGDGQSEDGL